MLCSSDIIFVQSNTLLGLYIWISNNVYWLYLCGNSRDCSIQLIEINNLIDSIDEYFTDYQTKCYNVVKHRQLNISKPSL